MTNSPAEKDSSPPQTGLDFERVEEGQMRDRALALLERLRRRRSVRHFSTEGVPLDVVESCIEAAAQAPSGANRQPWSFVLVTDPDLKRRIRRAAEEEEKSFYGGRAPRRWLDDLAPLATDWSKPFLSEAPALIVVFAQQRGATGAQHYYVQESVGIATGFLLSALHQCGLATLTHTPSPMRFLCDVLGRPDNERAFMLIPVGYPAPDCRVPDIKRKAFDEVLSRNTSADPAPTPPESA